MDKKEALIGVAIFLIVFTTAFLIYLNIREKILYSPEEILPSLEGISFDTAFCYDDDGGLDYFTKSTVAWGVGDGEIHYSTDYCVSDSVWEIGTLFEMHCLGNDFKIKDMKCPGSCEQGTCVE